MKKALEIVCVTVIVGALGSVAMADSATYATEAWATVSVGASGSVVMADVPGFTLEGGSSNAHAHAEAELMNYPVSHSASVDGATSATAVARANYGYFHYDGSLIELTVRTTVQANITTTSNSIQSSGSLTWFANTAGISAGEIDNTWSGTITIGTSEEFPSLTEGLTLMVSLGGSDLQLEINSVSISSSTEIEVQAGETLNVDFRHHTGAPEPATMSLLALGGLAILRKRRKQ